MPKEGDLFDTVVKGIKTVFEGAEVLDELLDPDLEIEEEEDEPDESDEAPETNAGRILPAQPRIKNAKGGSNDL